LKRDQFDLFQIVFSFAILLILSITVKDWAKPPLDHIDPYHLGIRFVGFLTAKFVVEINFLAEIYVLEFDLLKSMPPEVICQDTGHETVVEACFLPCPTTAIVPVYSRSMQDTIYSQA
jgi:hypothetical protein